MIKAETAREALSIGTSCEFVCAVRELAPTIPQRHENEGWMAGGRRRICAAKADVLPDGTGFAAIAGGDPHGIDWDCAETAIANSGRSSRGFIDRKSTRLNSSHLGISYAGF